MVYTLAGGAQGRTDRLYYSLYGGVEELPDRTPVLKELAVLVAIPTVTIALLAAVLSFHVPRISQAGGSGSGTLTAAPHSLVLSGKNTGSTSSAGSTAATAAAPNPSSQPAGSASAAGAPAPNLSSAPVMSLTQVGNDNGQGIIGGMGSGGSTVGGSVPTPADSSTFGTTNPDGIGATINTPVVESSTTVDTDQPSLTTTATVPLTDTSVTLDPGL